MQGEVVPGHCRQVGEGAASAIRPVAARKRDLEQSFLSW